MTHKDVCIFCMSGIKSNCPWLTVPSGDLKEFIKDEFGDPLRTARGVIWGMIGCGLIWILIALAFSF